jgi:putative oxidoreductase
MKIIVVSARILLGLMFFVFGLDTFVHFIPATPPTEGFAGAFIGALIHSHYVLFVGAVQLIAGALLLSNRFLPLALALLAPVIANILVFHITMLPGTLPPAILAAALWAILAWKLRSYFAPLFVQKAVLS